MLLATRHPTHIAGIDPLGLHPPPAPAWWWGVITTPPHARGVKTAINMLKVRDFSLDSQMSLPQAIFFKNRHVTLPLPFSRGIYQLVQGTHAWHGGGGGLCMGVVVLQVSKNISNTGKYLLHWNCTTIIRGHKFAGNDDQSPKPAKFSVRPRAAFNTKLLGEAEQ